MANVEYADKAIQQEVDLLEMEIENLHDEIDDLEQQLQDLTLGAETL